MLYIDLYWEKHEKIFLSEIIRPRALIFALPRGHMLFIGLYREKHEKNSYLKPQGLEP